MRAEPVRGLRQDTRVLNPPEVMARIPQRWPLSVPNGGLFRHRTSCPFLHEGVRESKGYPECPPHTGLVGVEVEEIAWASFAGLLQCLAHGDLAQAFCTA